MELTFIAIIIIFFFFLAIQFAYRRFPKYEN